MPEKSIVPGFGQCTACALAAQKGSATGSLPTSHSEVCCLFKFQRQGQPPSCLKATLHGASTCGGLCGNCPSGSKLRQVQSLAKSLPEHPASSDAEKARPAATGKRGGLKIAPRRRPGFRKLTIEIRPPKFKRKLWFGTYEHGDIDRARDAINYYMGVNAPYHLADSPSIFARYKLGIEYNELHPSCDQFVPVGKKPMRASVFFARQVKEVIQNVTGKRKGQQRRPRVAGKKGAKKEPSTPEPVLSCASGVTSLPCASDCASAMAWDDVAAAEAEEEAEAREAGEVAEVAAAACGASSPNANSELASTVHQPPIEIFTIPGEIPFESQQFSFNSDLDAYVQDVWDLSGFDWELDVMEDDGPFRLFPLDSE